MKIILIEDHKDYRDTLKEFIRREKLPGYKEERDLLEGGLYDVSARLLDTFNPDMREKTLLIVDGTLNYNEGEEEMTLPGNAFDLVSDWIEERVKPGILAANVGIILNPSSLQYLNKDFSPFKRIKDVCKKNSISLRGYNKGTDVNALLKDIQSFFLSPEGKGQGFRK